MWENGAEIRGEPYVRMANALDVGLVELLTGQSNELNKHLLEMEKLIKLIRIQL